MAVFEVKLINSKSPWWWVGDEQVVCWEDGYKLGLPPKFSADVRGSEFSGATELVLGPLRDDRRAGSFGGYEFDDSTHGLKELMEKVADDTDEEGYLVVWVRIHAL
jgi:hypothetical protein